MRRLSGYNTRWALKVLDGAMEGAVEGGVEMVFFGANDTGLPDKARAHQHVPLRESAI